MTISRHPWVSLSVHFLFGQGHWNRSEASVTTPRCGEAKEMEMGCVLRGAPDSVNKHTIFLSVCQWEGADDGCNVIFENRACLIISSTFTETNKQQTNKKDIIPFLGEVAHCGSFEKRSGKAFAMRMEIVFLFMSLTGKLDVSLLLDPSLSP